MVRDGAAASYGSGPRRSPVYSPTMATEDGWIVVWSGAKDGPRRGLLSVPVIQPRETRPHRPAHGGARA